MKIKYKNLTIRNAEIYDAAQLAVWKNNGTRRFSEEFY